MEHNHTAFTKKDQKMNESKKYEILETLPTYGPMHVTITKKSESFYSVGFPVRFFKSDGTNWVANFKPGWSTFTTICELNNSDNLIVIAFGTCYIMNPNNTKAIEAFGEYYCGIFKASKYRIVLQELTELTIIEADGRYWFTERISWDGLADIKIESNIVTGLAYDPMCDSDEWVHFSYNLDTKILTGGSYKKYETINKPWWKIW